MPDPEFIRSSDCTSWVAHDMFCKLYDFNETCVDYYKFSDQTNDTIRYSTKAWVLILDDKRNPIP